MKGSARVSFLAWDSEFFGRRIARVVATHLDDASLAEILDEARDESIECLYLLVGAEDSAAVRAVETGGFRPVDVRVTRERFAPDDGSSALPGNIELCNAEDVPGLCRIARTSHRDSRFYQDPFFPDARCDDLYEAWIRNAWSGGAAGILVARSAGHAVGYVTCEIPEPGLGNLGLVAVHGDHGGKGYGGRMVEGALAWLADQGCTRVRVVTQARNIPASRLYESVGFSTIAVENSYHLWLDGGRPR